jgi:hypothetical protein
MFPIVFSMLGVSACTFLIYVLVRFRRKLLRGRKNSVEESRLTEVDVRRIEAALMLARTSSHAGAEQQAKNETRVALSGPDLLQYGIFLIVGYLSAGTWPVYLTGNRPSLMERCSQLNG